MIVPQYWAEAKETRRLGGRQVTLRRFGWSDESEAAAERHAQERLAAAFRDWESGRPLPRREPKVAYNGAEGVPIREEIIRRSGDTIITRNSYGALCLNTPDVMFGDVDVNNEPAGGVRAASCLGLLAVLGAAAMLLVTTQAPSSMILAAVLVLALSGALFLPVARLIHRIQCRFYGTPHDQAIRRLRSFSNARPDWHLRVYRTPAGLRVLVMHRTFDPGEAEAGAFFKAIRADTIYMRMCERQKCFRARLTPKPWRVGYGKHLKPQPGVWPIRRDRLSDRQHWVAGYERACEGFSSCRFIEQLGTTRVDTRAEAVRRLHDDYCQANGKLPLA